jgi:hypothetical protein
MAENVNELQHCYENLIVVDCGANLTNKKFLRDLDSVLQRARDSGKCLTHYLVEIQFQGQTQKSFPKVQHTFSYIYFWLITAIDIWSRVWLSTLNLRNDPKNFKNHSRCLFLDKYKMCVTHQVNEKNINVSHKKVISFYLLVVGY